MKKSSLLVPLILAILFCGGFAAVHSQGQTETAEAMKSRCHVFVDYQFIWTVEMVEGEYGIVPVVNIITFSKGQWDLRPEQIHLHKNRRREAEIERFSIDTGVAGEPYEVPYLKVLGESFIGMDLIGEFDGFEELSKVYIDLADNRFVLEAVDCFQYETLVGKINQINFDSPDLRQDFSVLKLRLHGRREARRRHF
jgi:hypothetical protein